MALIHRATIRPTKAELLDDWVPMQPWGTRELELVGAYRFDDPDGEVGIETHVLSSKSDVAYAELRRRILSGDLAPGSRLAQYELATSLNMSITPLREAIRKLSSENLVDLDTHRNVYVARIGATEARKLFEVRLLLDPPAVELAAARRTADDIAAMEAAIRPG